MKKIVPRRALAQGPLGQWLCEKAGELKNQKEEADRGEWTVRERKMEGEEKRPLREMKSGGVSWQYRGKAQNI